MVASYFSTEIQTDSAPPS
nr:unnamed protein product [Callosobruchus chinensis]